MSQIIDVTFLYDNNKYFFPKIEAIGQDFEFTPDRISALAEDRSGHLWVGTIDEGLWKFDGYHFKKYWRGNNHLHNFPGNSVMSMVIDSNDILWVLTENALCFFNAKEDRFIQINELFNKGTQTDLEATCMSLGMNGHFYIGSENAKIIEVIPPENLGYDLINAMPRSDLLNRFKIRTYHLVLDNSMPQNGSFFALELDSKDKLWISYSNTIGFIEFNFDQLKMSNSGSYETYFLEFQQVGRLKILRKIALLDDAIWFSSSSGFHYINTQEKIPTMHRVAKRENPSNFAENFNLLSKKGEKIYWYADINASLKMYLSESQTTCDLSPHNAVSKANIYDNVITSMIQTHSGVIFLGTAWGGLYKFNPNGILSSFHPDLQKFHLDKSSNLRMTFLDRSDKVWILADEIYMLDRYTGELLLEIDHQMLGQKKAFKNKIIQDISGKYWVCMEGEGLISFDIEKNERNEYGLKNKKHILEKCYTTSVLEDKEGMIWTGAFLNKGDTNKVYTSLVRINPYNMEISYFDLTSWPLGIKKRPRVYVYHILEEDNVLWLATGFGLVKFDKETQQIKRYPVTLFEDDPESYKVMTLLTDYRMPEKYLWLGTREGGLILFDKINETFSSKPSWIDQLGHHVNSLLLLESGAMWLASDKGIFKVDILRDESTTLQVKKYSKTTGLITNDFGYIYGHNGILTQDGEIVFSGDKGFQIIDPHMIYDLSQKIKPKFTSFSINNKVVNNDQNDEYSGYSLDHTENIKLTFSDNTVGFQMTFPNFESKEQINYSFFLENYDDYWIDRGKFREINYTKIPPGRYRIYGKVTRINSSWEVSIPGPAIQILPPWYKSPYAIITYVLIALGLFYAIIIISRNRQKLKLSIKSKQLETENLKKLDKMKSRFFSNISHEFRTPLTLIKAPANELRKSPISSEFQKSLDLIYRNAERLEKYISDILELSKLDAKKTEIQKHPVDLYQFSEYIISGFSEAISNKGLSIHFHSDKNPYIFYLDPDKFETILSNLLSNAIKYSSVNGNIDISLSRCMGSCSKPCADQGECLLLRVRDNGIGIRKENISNIFSRYYRAERQDEKQIVGTGLGLSLVKEQVLLHDGNIRVESEENEYTEFILRFPFKPFDEKDQSLYENFKKGIKNIDPLEQADLNKDPSFILTSRQGADKLILIVEDDLDMRKMIAAFLEPTFQIAEASNGHEGLEIAIQQIPDLIITDLMMPIMDGIKFARQIRLNDLTSHIPIIILTAKAEMQDKMLGLRIGADDYLIKPFYKEELLTRINNLIKQRQALVEKFSKQLGWKINELPAPSMEQKFIQRMNSFIEENLSDEKFTVEILAHEMNLSRTQLYRKVKALSGKSVTDYIQNIRLERSAELIQQGSHTISEIAYQTGFSSPSYFSKAFKKYFGSSPSAFKAK